MKLPFKVILLLLFSFNFSFAQENQNKKSVFQSYPELKVYAGIPFGIGDNFISKGHDPKINYGLYVSPFSLFDIKVGIGVDFSRFKVSDVSLVGNGTSTNMGLVYGSLSYPLIITEKFEFEPKVGIGASWIQQKMGGEDFGRMEGTTVLLGSSLEYNLEHPFVIFIGTDYSYSKYNVEARADYKGFFENVNKLSVYAGIKFTMRKKKNLTTEIDNP